MSSSPRLLLLRPACAHRGGTPSAEATPATPASTALLCSFANNVHSIACILLLAVDGMWLTGRSPYHLCMLPAMLHSFTCSAWAAYRLALIRRSCRSGLADAFLPTLRYCVSDFLCAFRFSPLACMLIP